MKRLLAIALLSVTPALAGPFDQPYSIIETDRARSADPNLRPVIVNRVDGQNSMNNRAVIEPGPHKVTIDLPPRKGFTQATQVTFDLETKPCVRYYVAAELKSPTLQEWTPVVRHEDPIGECRKKFGVS
jgi:hypothetical protein